MDSHWHQILPRLQSLSLDSGRIASHPELQGVSRGQSVLVCEADPQRFLDYVFGALFKGCHVWFGSPEWGAQRREEALQLSQAVRVLGQGWGAMQLQLPAAHSNILKEGDPQTIAIPTGGSSGGLHYALHNWTSLTAAAAGFSKFWGEGTHRTLCVLPVYHISGFMQAVRVLHSGGQLYLGNPSNPREALPAGFAPEGCFLSLVPLQLRRLMDSGAAAWLRRFGCIFVGGGPSSRALLDRARACSIPLAPSYGMTETAAMVAVLRPEYFLDGCDGVGQILPHARVEISADNCGEGPSTNPGRIAVFGASLARAVHPGALIHRDQGYQTQDLGYFDETGRLCIVGRSDRMIISGGMKIDPAEVEMLLMDQGLVADVYVLGREDSQWGAAVTAFYVPRPQVKELEMMNLIRQVLSSYHVPKKWVRLDRLPRSAAGKIDLAELERHASA